MPLSCADNLQKLGAVVDERPECSDANPDALGEQESALDHVTLLLQVLFDLWNVAHYGLKPRHPLRNVSVPFLKCIEFSVKR